MDEAQLRSICKATGWQLSWHSDYFSEDRSSDDIIYDLIAEQNYGFTLDWKYDASDILWNLKRCLSLDVAIRKETSTFSNLKPFNQLEERYRTVTLVKGDQEMTIVYCTYADEDAGFLAQQIVSFAGISDKKVVDVSTRGDDSYAFVVINNGVTRYDLEPFEYHEIAVKSSAEALAVAAQRARNKYFYIPILTNNVTEIPGNNQTGSLNVLTYKKGEVYQTDYYASRVLPGQKLVEAVRHDLAQDFRYEGEFTICDYRVLDTATGREGNVLPRLLVNVDAGYFDTDGLHVLGAEVMWRSFILRDFANRHNLGFDLHE